MPRLALLPLALLSACQIAVGNGVSASETREVPAFERVADTTSVDVAVEAGPEASVLVTCDENLLPLVITDVQGDTLRIRTQDDMDLDPRVDCRVDVTVPALLGLVASGSGDLSASGDLTGFEEATCTGSGDLVAEGIASDDVHLESTGSGDLTASGTTSTLGVDSTGSGGVDARDLLAGCVSVLCTGSGDVQVSASTSLDATLTGSGDVEVWGNPADCNVQTTGSGEVSYQ